MSSFGQWYEEKKQEENGTTSSWSFDTESLLPSYESFSSLKTSLESQMPKKVFGMGYQQRFRVFCLLLFLSALFFALAFFVGLPLIATRPQKFALSFTMGSLMFMGSFGILKGPMEHLKSMCQADRLYFTFFYLGSMLATIVCTFTYGGIRGYVLVLSASGVQLVALVWYLVSFLPGGTAGLQYVAAALSHLLQPFLAACARFYALCLGYCFSWATGTSS